MCWWLSTQKAMLRLWTYLPLQGQPGSCVCEGLLELMGYTLLDGGRMLCPGGIQGCLSLFLFKCEMTTAPRTLHSTNHHFSWENRHSLLGCCPLESASHIFKIEKAMISNQNDLFVMGNTWVSFLFLLPCCVFPNQAFRLEVFVS